MLIVRFAQHGRQNKLQISFDLLVFRQLAHFNHAAAIPIGALRESVTPVLALRVKVGTERALKPLP